MANYIILLVLAVLVPTAPANPVDDVCQKAVRSKLTDIKSKLTEIQSIRTETAKLVRNCESTAFEDCCEVSLFYTQGVHSYNVPWCYIVQYFGYVAKRKPFRTWYI